MQKTGEQMADDLHHFRRGDRERAFHGLLENRKRERACVDRAPSATKTTRRLREFLVEVIWQAPSGVGDPVSRGRPCLTKTPRFGSRRWTAWWGTSLRRRRSKFCVPRESRPFADRNRADDFLAWLNEGIEQVED